MARGRFAPCDVKEFDESATNQEGVAALGHQGFATSKGDDEGDGRASASTGPRDQG
jgi:hypothetical protein